MAQINEIPVWRVGRTHRSGIRIPLTELKERIRSETIGAATIAA